MIVYDLDCQAPIGNFRVAALMDIRKGLIEKIELFMMPGRLKKKKENITETKSLAN